MTDKLPVTDGDADQCRLLELALQERDYDAEDATSVSDGLQGCTSAAPEPERPSSPAREPGALAGLRVLVAEDDQDARDLLTQVLFNAGATVIPAASGLEALGLLLRCVPEVIVSDIGMPDEDGIALMRRIRALDASDGGGVPSIALTAFTQAKDRTASLTAGFNAHLCKPANVPQLIATILQVTGSPPCR